MSWKTESLGKLLAPSGNTRAKTVDLPILSITMHDGLVDQSEKFRKRVASRDISNYRVVYTNELVVGFPIDEGVLGFQTKYPAAVVSPAYGIWKLRRPEETHIPFIEGYLRSSEARNIYASKMRGAVARRRSITREAFLEIEIPFPPFDKQRKIAEVLDKAATLRSQRQESLQHTEKLIQSIFLDMFGDPVENPKDWEVVSFEEEMEKISYGTSIKCSDVAEKGSRTVLRIPNVASGRIGWNNLKYASLSASEWSSLKLTSGDILFVRTNGNPSMVARTAVFEGDYEAAFASYLIRVRLKPGSKLKAEFVNFVLSMPSWRVQLLKLARTTAGNYNINTQAIKGLEIIAPDMEAQNRFCQAVNNQRDLVKALDEYLLEADSLFFSIQQRAFRGELDLSRLTLDDEVESTAHPLVSQPPAVEGRFKRPGSFIAPPEIEAQMLAFEDWLDMGPGNPIPWSEDFFKYRILSQVLIPPFSFNEIWEAVNYDMGDANYEDVKAKVFEYVEAGIVEQQFDMERKEIVFYPRP
jgi:type I restriction enzyme S subunit